MNSNMNSMKLHRKTLQLCQQVAETLNYVLSGECHDAELQSLLVLDVQPAPNASHLLVTVAPQLPGEVIDPVAVLARLNSVASWLRSEVARSITRKRAPQFVFQVLRSLEQESRGNHVD
jgi:ribosome-binding factor A